MRQVERDGEHIWLRQSVTFSVDGQSRTLEIGIPLRAGATPDEIEALLAEADAGMERIGRHLEERVARLGGTAASIAPEATARVLPHPEQPAVASPAVAEPLVPPIEQPAPAAVKETASPPTHMPAATPAPATAPAPDSASAPVRSIAERPVPPASPISTPAAEREPTSPTTASTPLALKDFIAAVQVEQGLNPKQAMERLGVKSLAGLNLREALEVLRRQALRDGAAAAPEAESAPVAAPAPAIPSTAPAATSASPRYFEEEDDNADIIFSEDDDEELNAEAAEAIEEDDELDEVPDFGSPPVEPVAVEPVAAAVAGKTPAAESASAAPAPAPGESRAARILTHMRGVRGGGVASAQQRNAFKNIVVAELGEPKAKALIAGIWRITPEKLGPEQLDALNNWGKRETFADDTELVLAAVKAEREREAAGADSDAAPPSGAPTRSSSRRASRATPTGGA